jgi:hypothetical protein
MRNLPPLCGPPPTRSGSQNPGPWCWYLFSGLTTPVEVANPCPSGDPRFPASFSEWPPMLVRGIRFAQEATSFVSSLLFHWESYCVAIAVPGQKIPRHPSEMVEGPIRGSVLISAQLSPGMNVNLRQIPV